MSMELVTAEQMAQIDARAERDYAIPALVLMENAGMNAWERLRGRLAVGQRLVFVVGRGNNGGDAAVMARACVIGGGYRAQIVTPSGAHGELGTAQLEICRRLGIEQSLWNDDVGRRALARADWIVDGLVGSGLKGRLRSEAAEMVAAIDDSPARVCSIDVPSGIGDLWRADYDTVRADLTLTMELPKRCLYLPAARMRCGVIEISPVGFPRQLKEGLPGALLSDGDLQGLLGVVEGDAYKQRRGVVDLFAGSLGAVGAAILAARASSAGGAGLVRLSVDREIWSTAAAAAPSVMVAPHHAEDELQRHPIGRHSLVVGPGWGISPTRATLLRRLLKSGSPGVLDADGLNLLSQFAPNARSGICAGRWVLTPHPGEFARLIGEPSSPDDPLPAMQDLAHNLQAIVVLKGHVTTIVDPGRFWIYDGCNPALATGGSGDVLAGAIGALLARGLSPSAAACAGVLLHGLAGEAAWRHEGWFTADRLIPHLSRQLADRMGRGNEPVSLR